MIFFNTHKTKNEYYEYETCLSTFYLEAPQMPLCLPDSRAADLHVGGTFEVF